METYEDLRRHVADTQAKAREAQQAEVDATAALREAQEAKKQAWDAATGARHAAVNALSEGGFEVYRGRLVRLTKTAAWTLEAGGFASGLVLHKHYRKGDAYGESYSAARKNSRCARRVHRSWHKLPDQIADLECWQVARWPDIKSWIKAQGEN